MKKVNHKLLSIPPHISTAWNNINTLNIREVDGKSILIILLHNGTTIEVPNLDSPLIEQIFAAHAQFLEQETEQPRHFPKQRELNRQVDLSMPLSMPLSIPLELPFQFNKGEGIENLHSLLQHNPDQKNAPDLPKEIITKITSITHILGMDMKQMSLLNAQPHCNCVYCQISRAIHESTSELEEEELVADEDLRFREWEINREGDNLYLVTNPLDKEEHYQVFLGNPIGCTCGEKNCEHIRMVLKS